MSGWRSRCAGYSHRAAGGSRNTAVQETVEPRRRARAVAVPRADGVCRLLPSLDLLRTVHGTRHARVLAAHGDGHGHRRPGRARPRRAVRAVRAHPSTPSHGGQERAKPTPVGTTDPRALLPVADPRRRSERAACRRRARVYGEYPRPLRQPFDREGVVPAYADRCAGAAPLCGGDPLNSPNWGTSSRARRALLGRK